MQLNKQIARHIVERLASHGTAPEVGVEYFSVGIDKYLRVLDSEYLSSYVKEGGNVFKVVKGVYGGGKTHFLYSVRNLAWKHNFVVAYLSLSPKICPFHRLDLVYKEIAKDITPPLSEEELISGYESGVPAYLRRWFAMHYQEDGGSSAVLLDIEHHLHGIESISFRNAILNGMRALARGLRARRTLILFVNGFSVKITIVQNTQGTA